MCKQWPSLQWNGSFFSTVCIYFSSEPLLVLIEYVPFGDLLGYLRKSRGLNDTYYKDSDIKPQSSLTSQQLMTFAWQIADGMSYLSSKSVSKVVLKYYLLIGNCFAHSLAHCGIYRYAWRFVTPFTPCQTMTPSRNIFYGELSSEIKALRHFMNCRVQRK